MLQCPGYPKNLKKFIPALLSGAGLARPMLHFQTACCNYAASFNERETNAETESKVQEDIIALLQKGLDA